MVKKLLVGFAVMLMIVPATLACGPTSGVANGMPVPPAANSIMKIKVDQLVNNPELKVAYEQLVKGRSGWPQTADAALTQVLTKTGIDLSTTTSAVFFADVESGSDQQNMYAGVIATGSFKQPAVIDSIQSAARQTLTTTDYKGFTVYKSAQDKYEIAFLSSSQFVAGAAKAVRDTLDVSKGDQKALTGAVIDTLERFGGAAITAASAPPEAVRSQAEKQVPQQAPVSLAAFQNIDTIGFSLDPQGLTVNARVDAHFTSATSVTDAKDAITGLISLTKGTTQDPNIKAMLGSIQVSTSGQWLSVRDTFNPTEIASVAGSFQPKK